MAKYRERKPPMVMRANAPRPTYSQCRYFIPEKGDECGNEKKADNNPIGPCCMERTAPIAARYTQHFSSGANFNTKA